MKIEPEPLNQTPRPPQQEEETPTQTAHYLDNELNGENQSWVKARKKIRETTGGGL